jgi:hypothetical protein
MATWKKVVVSGSAISQLNNDANYLVNGTASASLTGSFTGSFTGDGSGLTGVTASAAFSLSSGNGINSFSYDGTSAQTVSVDSASLAGDGLFAFGGKLFVSPSGSTISVNEVGIGVIEANFKNIPNSALTNSGSVLGTTPVDLGATVTSVAGLTLTGAVVTGSFSGSFSGTTDLPDLVSGDGLTGGPYDGSATATFSVQASGSTINVSSAGIKVAAAGITAVEISSSVAGNGLAGGNGTALSVNVDDSSIEITNDALNIKAGGVSNAMLVNSSSILGSTPVALGATVTSVAGLTLTNAVATGSFTGSFAGNGANLLGVVSASYALTASYAENVNADLFFSGSTGTGVVDLASQALSILGTANEIETSAGGTTLTIGLPQDVTIGQDLIVSRNLTVLGTASFQNTTNLDVADRFILLASGSNTTGDGGIVVQQGTQGFGETFAYDAATERWAVTGSFDASQATFVPEAFMSAVIEGAASDPTAVVAKLTKKGNMFIAADESIWIYS